MPRYKIKIDFDGEIEEYESEAECEEYAEWSASDSLRDIVRNRTSYSVELMQEGE